MKTLFSLDEINNSALQPNNLSRYIRTTQILSCSDELKLPSEVKIRYFSQNEADTLAQQIKKRNVFARYSGENDFYVQRVRALSGRTVIEVWRQGDPDQMINDAKNAADLAEQVVVLSSILASTRKEQSRSLAVSTQKQSEFDVTIGQGLYYLKSKSHIAPSAGGIEVDGQFCRRFDKCGFGNLLSFASTSNEIAIRSRHALTWLFESRLEPNLAAAFVKTAIAMETLLIFNDSEPLSGSLSERTAFMLSSDVQTRYRISQLVKSFYGARSQIVHGGRRKGNKPNIGLLETTDRLILLCCLVMAANAKGWSSQDTLKNWFDMERWGIPSAINRPFPRLYLANAMNKCKEGII